MSERLWTDERIERETSKMVINAGYAYDLMKRMQEEYEARIAELEAMQTCPKRVRIKSSGEVVKVLNKSQTPGESENYWVRNNYIMFQRPVGDCEPVPDEIDPSAGVTVYDYRDDECSA